MKGWYRLDPRRLAGGIQRRGLWSCLSLMMAAIACYGALALVVLMSFLGVSLAFNEAIWAGSIVAFTLAASLVIAPGHKHHKSFKPLVPGLLGGALMVYTMLVDYRLAFELLAFALLASATYLDYHLRRGAKVNPNSQSTNGDSLL